MSSSLPVLAGHGLSCIKRDRILFEEFSIALHEGELLYLRGPNGAGKTSLLRILVGLSVPDTGCVEYRGSSLQDCHADFATDLIYFGHKLGISALMTATENLHFWCQQHSISASRERLWDVLAELGLVGLEDIPCNQLSAGQQRRVALARFWLKQDARVWVFDEPFTALDVHGIELLENHISRHVNSGGAVLMTSHQALKAVSSTKEVILEYRI